MEEKPAPHNPLGAKGAGEGGIIPVGGVIANAVAAALAPFGVEPRDLPLTPPRLWELITAAKGLCPRSSRGVPDMDHNHLVVVDAIEHAVTIGCDPE